MKSEHPFTSILIALAISIIFTSCASATAENSIWTLKNGQKITGEIHKVQNNRAEINLVNGRRIGIDIQGFNPTSQREIQNWIASHGGTAEYASWIECRDADFLKKWPTTAYGPNSPTIKRILKETKPGHYVFESDHYRFISDNKLSPQLIQIFATLFETTYQYNMELPLNVPGRYRGENHKFLIYLIEKYETYLRMGGAPNSAGIYLRRNQAILVPLPALGAYKRGSKWMHKKGGENMVIVHEITHQLMEGELSSAWFTEGSAEYIAATRYTHAAFHAHENNQRIFNYVTSKKASMAHFSRRLGSRVAMPNLKHFMNMPYAEFSHRSNANRNYGIALLLTNYFYKIDGSGNANNIKNYIKALQRGKSKTQAQAALLNGRSYETLQQSFAKYCAKNGLSLDFDS